MPAQSRPLASPLTRRPKTGPRPPAPALLLPLLALLAFAPLPAAAQPAALGRVSGQVLNEATRAYLEGAEVSLAATEAPAAPATRAPLSTTTDREGVFAFSDLPPGEYRLGVRYPGLTAFDTTVVLAPGGTPRVEVALSGEIYHLSKIVVTGEREGDAASMARQKAAGNLVNVVATDAYGNVADGNMGAFLQNITGIAPQYWGSDIVGVSLRGAPPDLTAVTVNGAITAAATAGYTAVGDRAAQIDQIPAEFIKEVEVSKATRPDQWAEGLGGQINLVPKSPFDFKSRVLTYRAGVSLNTYRHDPVIAWHRRADGDFSPRVNMGRNFSASFMDTFGGARTVGVSFSVNYTNTNTINDGWATEFLKDDYRATRVRKGGGIFDREVYGMQASVAWRPDPATRLWLLGSTSRYRLDSMREDIDVRAGGDRRVADYSMVSRAAIEAGALPLDSDGNRAGVAPGYSRGYTELLHASLRNYPMDEIRRSRRAHFEAGLDKIWGSSNATFTASFNPASADGVARGFQTNLPAIGVAIDRSDERQPSFSTTYGPTDGLLPGADFSNYYGMYTYSPSWSKDQIGTLRGSFRHKLDLGDVSLVLKAGADYRRKKYRADTFVYFPVWEYVGPDGRRDMGADGVRASINGVPCTDDDIGQFVRPGYVTYGAFKGRYPGTDTLDLAKVTDLFNAYLEGENSLFKPYGTTVADHAPPSSASEDVAAAYLQANARWGRLNILAGLRMEDTRVESDGSFKDINQPGLTHREMSGGYQKFFPSLHLRYDFTRQLVARASVSTTSARPALSWIVPNTTVNHSDIEADGNRVTQGNPDLRPNYSVNYDFSVEYYLRPSGIVSLGLYQKDVKDFIGSFRDRIGYGPDNGFNGQYEDYWLVTRKNIYRAKIRGVELEYRQRLAFLPKPFDSLTLRGNLTRLETTGEYTDGGDELAGFVPLVWNAGFSYTGRHFELRATWRFQDDYLRTYNADPNYNVRWEARHSLDLNLVWKFSTGLTVFIDANNVLNTTTYCYTTDKSRIYSGGITGPMLTAGISGRF
jgi:TonB-dependent receptor